MAATDHSSIPTRWNHASYPDSISPLIVHCRIHTCVVIIAHCTKHILANAMDYEEYGFERPFERNISLCSTATFSSFASCHTCMERCASCLKYSDEPLSRPRLSLSPPKASQRTYVNVHRNSFSFDRELYKDDLLEVTPSSIFISKRCRPRAIDLGNVVQVRLRSREECKSNPIGRRLRYLFGRRALLKQQDVVIDVRNRTAKKQCSIALPCNDPNAFMTAVHTARAMVYNPFGNRHPYQY